MITKTWNYAQRSAHIAPSVIREILKLTLKPFLLWLSRLELNWKKLTNDPRAFVRWWWWK